MEEKPNNIPTVSLKDWRNKTNSQIASMLGITESEVAKMRPTNIPEPRKGKGDDGTPAGP